MTASEERAAIRGSWRPNSSSCLSTWSEIGGSSTDEIWMSVPKHQCVSVVALTYSWTPQRLIITCFSSDPSCMIGSGVEGDGGSRSRVCTLDGLTERGSVWSDRLGVGDRSLLP